MHFYNGRCVMIDGRDTTASVQIPNGGIDNLLKGWAEHGTDKLAFTFYDKGYSKIKEGMMGNMVNNKYIKWDFSNPAHEAYFLNCFNGEEMMRKEYPVLYGMLQHTKRLAAEDAEAFHALKTGGAAGYVDRAHIHELVVRKSNRNDDAGENSLYYKGCTSLVSVKPAVHVTLEI